MRSIEILKQSLMTNKDLVLGKIPDLERRPLDLFFQW